jgi:hypothetical protein
MVIRTIQLDYNRWYSPYSIIDEREKIESYYIDEISS